MAHVQLTWKGLAEFRSALRGLPAAVRGEADHIVEDTANTAAVRIRSNYASHVHTGRLQASVKVTFKQKPYGLSATVQTRAPHAHLFEYGTAARQTSQGAYRGIMPPAPPAHAFLPVIRLQRRLMELQFVQLLQRHGFLEVRSDAAA